MMNDYISVKVFIRYNFYEKEHNRYFKKVTTKKTKKKTKEEKEKNKRKEERRKMRKREKKKLFWGRKYILKSEKLLIVQIFSFSI